MKFENLKRNYLKCDLKWKFIWNFWRIVYFDVNLFENLFDLKFENDWFWNLNLFWFDEVWRWLKKFDLKIWIENENDEKWWKFEIFEADEVLNLKWRWNDEIIYYLKLKILKNYWNLKILNWWKVTKMMKKIDFEFENWNLKKNENLFEIWNLFDLNWKIWLKILKFENYFENLKFWIWWILNLLNLMNFENFEFWIWIIYLNLKFDIWIWNDIYKFERKAEMNLKIWKFWLANAKKIYYLLKLNIWRWNDEFENLKNLNLKFDEIKFDEIYLKFVFDWN